MRVPGVALLCILSGVMGAAAMLAVVEDRRRISWREFQQWAEQEENPVRTGPHIPEEPAPEETARIKSICDQLIIQTGLDYRRIAGIAGTLRPLPRYWVSDEELRRAWDQIGAAGRMRIALNGLSPQDVEPAQGAFTLWERRLNSGRQKIVGTLLGCNQFATGPIR